MRQPLSQAVRDLNQEGRQALFIGAGVSMGCGLPGWQELVDQVVGNALSNEPMLVNHLNNGTNLLAARYAKQKWRFVGSYDKVAEIIQNIKLNRNFKGNAQE